MLYLRYNFSNFVDALSRLSILFDSLLFRLRSLCCTSHTFFSSVSRRTFFCSIGRLLFAFLQISIERQTKKSSILSPFYRHHSFAVSSSACTLFFLLWSSRELFFFPIHVYYVHVCLILKLFIRPPLMSWLRVNERVCVFVCTLWLAQHAKILTPTLFTIHLALSKYFRI